VRGSRFEVRGSRSEVIARLRQGYAGEESVIIDADGLGLEVEGVGELEFVGLGEQAVDIVFGVVTGWGVLQELHHSYHVLSLQGRCQLLQKRCTNLKTERTR